MDEKEAEALMSDIKHIFNEWDFLGVVGAQDDGGPFDEYDCLVEPIAALIQQHSNKDKLKNYIEQELNGHFGLKGAYSNDGLEKTLNKLIILSN